MEQNDEAGLPSYHFARSLRGFDPEQVSRIMWRLERDHRAALDRLDRANEEIATLRRNTVLNVDRASQAAAGDSPDVDVTDVGVTDVDVVGVVRMAERTAALIISEAHATADRHRTVTEQALARAEDELRHKQRALGAEAERVADLRRKLNGDMSRASMRLVELVDGEHGLGPFSEQTGSLLEFAELLARGQTVAGSRPAVAS